MAKTVNGRLSNLTVLSNHLGIDGVVLASLMIEGKGHRHFITTGCFTNDGYIALSRQVVTETLVACCIIAIGLIVLTGQVVH